MPYAGIEIVWSLSLSLVVIPRVGSYVKEYEPSNRDSEAPFALLERAFFGPREASPQAATAIARAHSAAACRT